MRSRWPVVLLASAVLAGCSGATDDGQDGGPGADPASTSSPVLVVPTPDDATATGTGVVATSAPDDAAATSTPPPDGVDLDSALNDEALLDQTRWILDHLQPGVQGPDVVSVAQRFDQAFLDQVPALQVGLIIAQLRSDGPYAVTDVLQGEGIDRSASLVLHSATEPLVMTVVLDAEGLISGLLFTPDTSGEAPEISSWADLDAALVEVGGQSQVVVGEVRDGACTTVHTTDGLPEGGEPFPSGSVVKLVVLAGVVDAVEAGELSWDEELTITDEVRSLPSGVLQERDAGSTVTVLEAAELMIAISDNTATDLLIGAVGQPQLRRSMETAGVDPLRLAPLVSTRQLFILGWGVDQETRDRWARATVPEAREALLADLPDDLSLVDPAAVTTPVWPDGVDWPLTGAEICGAHARLQGLAGTDAGEPVREILAANPGGPVPEGVTYQGFKGGSVPGVLALSYYVETGRPGAGGADGDAATQGPGAPDGHVLVVQTRSDEAIDQLRAMTIVGAGLGHLVGADG